MPEYTYLSPEWAAEAHRRLQAELTPEKMKFVSSSMVTFYKNCPDGKDRALFYRFVNGACTELTISEGQPPEADVVAGLLQDGGGGESRVSAVGQSACVAQLVEHFLGKEEVIGSIPIASSKNFKKMKEWLCEILLL